MTWFSLGLYPGLVQLKYAVVLFLVKQCAVCYTLSKEVRRVGISCKFVLLDIRNFVGGLFFSRNWVTPMILMNLPAVFKPEA